MDTVTRLIERMVPPRTDGGVAVALRSRRETILQRFAEAMREAGAGEAVGVLRLLDGLIASLDVAETRGEAALDDAARAHAEERFRIGRRVDEMLGEYRLLRAIAVDEMHEGLKAGAFTFPGVELVSLHSHVDAAIQAATAAFLEQFGKRLRAAAETEAKHVAFLSHDLRNNLNGITLTVDLLVSRLQIMPDFAEDCESLLAGRLAIWETMEGMERLMQSERLKQRAVEVKIAPVKLRDSLERMLTNIRRRAREKGLAVENLVPPEVIVKLDEQLLRLVVQNLVGNALRYTDTGWLRVSLDRGATGYVLEVRDSGKGIAPDDQRKVFEAFHRGESQGEAGVGLGLAIVSAAAKLMGAGLEVESELGKGSVFRVLLPGG